MLALTICSVQVSGYVGSSKRICLAICGGSLRRVRSGTAVLGACCEEGVPLASKEFGPGPVCEPRLHMRVGYSEFQGLVLRFLFHCSSALQKPLVVLVLVQIASTFKSLLHFMATVTHSRLFPALSRFFPVSRHLTCIHAPLSPRCGPAA